MKTKNALKTNLSRETITLILCLLLITFCSAAMLTTLHVRDSMAELTGKALTLDVREGHSSGAEQLMPCIDRIILQWGKYEPVVSTYSRHDELERISSAVQRLRPLYDSRQFDELYLTLHELSDALDHFKSTELPTVANIL